MAQAAEAVASGTVVVVALARAFALEPDLPSLWQQGKQVEPTFPRFHNPPEGGVTAWYTMRLTAIGEARCADKPVALDEAIATYKARDQARTDAWLDAFAWRGSA